MNASHSALRVAFFGSAARFSCLALEALARRQHVVIVVTIEPFRLRLRHWVAHSTGIRPASPLRACARRLRIPVTLAHHGEVRALEETLLKVRPDLICIAVFPMLLGRSTLELAPLGAINAHPSLLPRHRGPLPLFWTYFSDDRETGVTIHHANERYDSGDIILQEARVLPRGYPAHQLDAELGESAAELLAEAADRIASGTAQRSTQNEAYATHAPRVSGKERMIRFDEWDCERTWHFLAGLAPRYREPLSDEHGQVVAYDAVTGYRVTGSRGPAGSIETVAEGWNLHCRDGIVMLSKAKA